MPITRARPAAIAGAIWSSFIGMGLWRPDLPWNRVYDAIAKNRDQANCFYYAINRVALHVFHLYVADYLAQPSTISIKPLIPSLPYRIFTIRIFTSSSLLLSRLTTLSLLRYLIVETPSIAGGL